MAQHTLSVLVDQVVACGVIPMSATAAATTAGMPETGGLAPWFVALVVVAALALVALFALLLRRSRSSRDARLKRSTIAERTIWLGMIRCCNRGSSSGMRSTDFLNNRLLIHYQVTIDGLQVELNSFLYIGESLFFGLSFANTPWQSRDIGCESPLFAGL